MKHATGAAASMKLAFAAESVSLTVGNDAPSANGSGTSALGASGAGFGLRGIAERVALLGGEVEAGPVPGGWRVRATVPTPASVPAPSPSRGPRVS
jgi:signal transduction histidine kinase